MTINDFEYFLQNYHDVFIKRKFSNEANDSFKKRTHNSMAKGTIAVMCPKCYNNTKHMVSQDSSIIVLSNTYNDCVSPFTKIEYKINNCKKCSAEDVIGIESDPNIADAISILNKKGYYTKYCCEGHSDRDSPYIYFSDLNILDVIHRLPLTWNIDYDRLRYYNDLIIRADGLIGKKQYLKY